MTLHGILPGLLLGFVLAGGAAAHVVDQLYVEFDRGGEHWQVVLYFDAGFALPEMRNDPQAPAPPRAWLVELEDDAHARLRREAESYLRDWLVLRLGGNTIEWTARYPDWERSPPDFPEFRNGGAYFRIAVTGPWAAEGGTLTCASRHGAYPNLVVQVAENRFVTISPGQEKELARQQAAAAPSADDHNGERGWTILILATAAILLVFVLARIGLRRPA